MQMSTTEITLVEHFARDSDALLGFSIELPVAGTAKEEYSFEFAGWVLGRQSAAVQIELIANDGPPRRVPVLFQRPDVVHHYPETPEDLKVGFWVPVSVIGMTPEFELLVQVILKNGLRVPVGRICGRHRALRSGFDPTIQPLLVNSLARTGTTWMMRLLSEHPSIATLRVYPYETRPGKYWMQLLGAMVEPAYQAQSVSKLGTFDAEWWASQDPFQRGWLSQHELLQQWFNSRFVEQVAIMCQQSLETCYREVAAVQHEGSPLYFAEKHIPDEVPGIIWELYPKTREIFVVRDFRDMLCSIRAFNKKRGTMGFNRDQVGSEQEYIYRLGREAQQLLSSWKARSQRACLVRYEDLVLQPTGTMQRVLNYLGLESGASLVQDLFRTAVVDTEELRAHRTSGTLQSSIGRWRDDLDSTSKLLCNQVFGGILQEFGYDPSEQTSAKAAVPCS
jgi:hypothetical protein